jgi:hypothetical protein
MIAGLCVAEERGAHDLKGVPEPVTLFRLARGSADGAGNGRSKCCNGLREQNLSACQQTGRVRVSC